jgi:hypothetical protein
MAINRATEFAVVCTAAIAVCCGFRFFERERACTRKHATRLIHGGADRQFSGPSSTELIASMAWIVRPDVLEMVRENFL